MREELEIMKNVSLVETYYFSSTEVTASPSASAHCGDEFSSRRKGDRKAKPMG